MSSPFLKVPESEWVASNALGFAIRDRYPVSPGHTLVIPRRLVATWFEATPEEQRALFELVEEVKRGLDASHPKPDGYNLGINVGEAAGQTVFHLHVHVIPRYQGDMADPRGGVRHVIPGKGNYLVTAAKPLATGGQEDPFLHHLEPLFARATEVAVLAAFVQDSGLEVLRESVEAALARGARVRILTGDYLAITQAQALKRLLDWMDENEARQEQDEERPGTRRGRFEARVVETAKLGRSFHPKSWRFEGAHLATAFVGSSNVSHAALRTGVEWNLRVERDQDPRAWREAVDAFEGWWSRALRFDAAWVEQYETRARKEDRPLPPGDTEAEPVPKPPSPHGIQLEALEALARSREEERQRALVVLATGLGKTLLAALDVEAFIRERGRPARVLFLAHRAELLAQAAETFRRQFPESRFGWFVADSSSLEGDLVFASVQKLSRDKCLAQLQQAALFDYVVVDEVHHAAAASYRAILERLKPEFLLGLTATPERADEGNVLGLFDDHLAYRADVGEGIARELLVPFAYYGLKDDVAYENIPWRNRRFDPELLEAAVQTEERMRRMWAAWEEHRATRTLVFCCSVSHAEFVKRWLAREGVRVMAVHSAPGSDDRAEALRKLASGALDAVCAVDLFNEGVDVPSVDRVVMLRPTESPVVFLQQLGRGLRKATGKSLVTVIDFVGNHRVFLERMRTLLELTNKSGRRLLRDFLVDGKSPELPPGCSVQVELEAKDLLRRLLPRESGDGEVERAYRELKAVWGRRPTAVELYRRGHPPAQLRAPRGLKDWGWFQFLAQEKGLSAGEALALEEGREWFLALENAPMSKSFKMVLLEALLEADALETGLSLDELARRSLDLLLRSPGLRRDIEGVSQLGDLHHLTSKGFLPYWKVNPIKAWTGTGWFQVEGERFVSRLSISEGARKDFLEMTRELVDYNLARYRARKRSVEAEVITFPPRTSLIAFPSLQAAAGAATLSLGSAPEEERVSLPLRTTGEELFAVRASGDSMNGGWQPIHDGDWVVMRPVRAAGLGALEGQVALVQVPDTAGHTYQLKRIVREGARWMLRSDNPSAPSREVTEDTVVPLAQLVEVIAPERLGPEPGMRMTDDALSRHFGFSVPPRSGRHAGHLFLFVTRKTVHAQPDRVDLRLMDRRPAETAFVLIRTAANESWTYAGVGRWAEDEGLWVLPAPPPR